MKQIILVLLIAYAFARAAGGDETSRVLIVVGPSSHPPGSHEVAAGGRLLQHCLVNSENVPGVEADVVFAWPRDRAFRETASTVVFLGDTFPPSRFPDSPRVLAELDEMMRSGCGIVCLHFATGLLGNYVAADGDHPLLRWLGGYYANRSCPHHQSIARIFPAARITPAAPEHPISRGWKEFTVHDEPYINNYFGGPDNQPAANVTVIATSQLPPEDPQREPVAWCVERQDGGRGFGIVMPHFYANWRDEDLRRCILNGIVWTAGRTVPVQGVRTQVPDLAKFEPAAVEFTPRSR